MLFKLFLLKPGAQGAEPCLSAGERGSAEGDWALLAHKNRRAGLCRPRVTLGHRLARLRAVASHMMETPLGSLHNFSLPSRRPEEGPGMESSLVLPVPCCCSCHSSHTSWPGHETDLPPESPACGWSLGLASPTLALLQTDPSLDSFCFVSGRCRPSAPWQSPPMWVWAWEGRGPGCCCRLLRGYLYWQVPRGSGELVGATAGAQVDFAFF